MLWGCGELCCGRGWLLVRCWLFRPPRCLPPPPSDCSVTDPGLVARVEAKHVKHLAGRGAGNPLVVRLGRVKATLAGDDTLTTGLIRAEWDGGRNEFWADVFAELDRLEACRIAATTTTTTSTTSTSTTSTSTSTSTSTTSSTSAVSSSLTVVTVPVSTSTTVLETSQYQDATPQDTPDNVDEPHGVVVSASHVSFILADRSSETRGYKTLDRLLFEWGHSTLPDLDRYCFTVELLHAGPYSLYSVNGPHVHGPDGGHPIFARPDSDGVRKWPAADNFQASGHGGQTMGAPWCHWQNRIEPRDWYVGRYTVEANHCQQWRITVWPQAGTVKGPETVLTAITEGCPPGYWMQARELTAGDFWYGRGWGDNIRNRVPRPGSAAGQNIGLESVGGRLKLVWPHQRGEYRSYCVHVRWQAQPPSFNLSKLSGLAAWVTGSGRFFTFAGSVCWAAHETRLTQNFDGRYIYVHRDNNSLTVSDLNAGTYGITIWGINHDGTFSPDIGHVGIVVEDTSQGSVTPSGSWR